MGASSDPTALKEKCLAAPDGAARQKNTTTICKFLPASLELASYPLEREAGSQPACTDPQGAPSPA